MDQLKASGKPFDISKAEVWDAWIKVKGNQGAAGVDGQSIEDFEKDLRGNLYRIWNRMSSGTYFPPPVKAVEIPKAHGADGVRVLGVPTVADRVAQTVVAAHLERRVEPLFHPDSYGYRPRRSALDAVGVCRRALLGVQLGDRSRHPEVLRQRPVGPRPQGRWSAHRRPLGGLYVKRWLAAELQLPDGSLRIRDRGTPQGSAVSPVLANLFMHYAFDPWLTREFPSVAFERYADDAVIHCVTECQAQRVLAALHERMVRSDWSCTRRRRRSCTARTATGPVTRAGRRSRSWGTCSDPGQPAGRRTG